MLEDLRGHVGAEQRIDHEHQDDQRQHKADGAPRDLQHRQDQHRAKEHIQAGRVALPQRLFGNVKAEHVKAAPADPEEQRRRHAEAGERPVIERHIAGAQRIGPAPVQAVRGPDHREAYENEQEQPCQVNAHMHMVHRRAEAGRPKVIEGKGDAGPIDDASQPGAVVARVQSGVILLLQLLKRLVVEMGVQGHRGLQFRGFTGTVPGNGKWQQGSPCSRCLGFPVIL